MAKVDKLEAAKRQLDAAIRMWFKNEDMLAIHTVSRAAFRVLHDLTQESDIKNALKTHITKVGPKRFNEETNFLKHADQDPAAEIDDNFHVFTEAGIGMAIGLYKHQTQDLTPEMVSFLLWTQFMRPGFYDLSDETNESLEVWRKASKTDPTKIEGQTQEREFGDALLHWCKLNWEMVTTLRKQSERKKAAPTPSGQSHNRPPT